MVNPIDPVCERARCLASLRADGEATEFEEAFLESHLRLCAGCREHACGIEASAALIRATPLVEPVALSLPARRRRATYSIRHLQIATAALVVLGAGLTGLAGIPRPGGSSTAPSATPPAYLDSASYEQKFLRALARPPAARWPGLKKLAN